jgi:hypothetical protein
MMRILVSSIILVVIVFAWDALVTAVGIWWLARHPPIGTDSYFIAGSWVYRLAVVVPLVLFSAWYWRRVFSRGG